MSDPHPNPPARPRPADAAAARPGAGGSRPHPAPILAGLQDRLAALMVADQRRLRRRLDRARADGDDLARLARDVAAAEARLTARAASLPTPRYPAGLPVSERKDEILAAIRDHQVVIVAGETGSGKSTQLPKICLELGRGVRGLIGHTQPRRIAARTLAERIADELGCRVGGTVGYTVRFTDEVGDATLVKLMTDGILLAEIQRDRDLSRYDTLIIDEAHERSLNIDFILGYLRQLLPRRPDLKVVVTSATIDTERFAQHFADERGPAPVVDVSGRGHPVEVRYRPLEGEGPDDPHRDQIQAICDAVEELGAEGPGDVLVFLSGEREIRDTAEAVRAMELRDTEILPLYARLSIAEQHRVFQPHRGRRIVLATNVAETSLTVPGIRYVVDPGTARISRYNRRTKVQRLPIEPVSQASANQRAGRCGRLGPGICVRLYAEDDLAARPPFTEPEILRTNLASVILQMAALGLGDVASFPFVDPPDARNIRDGIALLEELGALDPARAGTRGWLTPLGRRLAQLPIDPRLGRMVLEAARNGCVREVVVIAAALSIQDPRERPTDREQAAAQFHARFADKDSDFLAYLKLWDHLRTQQRAMSSNQFRRMCRAEFLNHLRIREWQDIATQLRQVTRELGIRTPAEPAATDSADTNADAIHRSLLAGLLSHIGVRDDSGSGRRPTPGRDSSRRDGRSRGRDGSRPDFLGARNARFAIAPGSGLARRPPRWVMAAELVETNRLWGRVAARIQPEWAERLGAHLVKRSYGEPYWDAARGTAIAHERVTLYGVPIVASRPVGYGRVDAAAARELFIRHALVEGDWTSHHAFLETNRKLVEEVRALEDRARRRDILVGDDTLLDFYDRRVGAEVTSGRHFDRWWKTVRRSQPDLLTFTAGTLVNPTAGAVSAASYPDVWRADRLSLPLTYEFEPGSATDGVTAHVPLPLMNQLGAAGFDWQIPGLRAELVTALIRSLPKPLRRNFVPAPDHAAAFLAEGRGPSDGPLAEVLSRYLRRHSGLPVRPDDFDLERVPHHLRMAFLVHDDEGRTLALDRDLALLEAQLRDRTRHAISRVARGVDPNVERSGLRGWTMGELPRVVEATRDGHAVRGYPALVDEGDTVAVRLLTSEAEQRRAMWRGTRRLLRLTVASPLRSVRGAIPPETTLTLAHAPHGAAARLYDDCTDAAIDRLVADAGGPAWDEAGFLRLRDVVAGGLVDAVVDVVTALGQVVRAAARIESCLEELTAPAAQPTVADVRAQLARLVHPGFVTESGAGRLADVSRYLRAIEQRLDKFGNDPARDQERMRRLQRLEREHQELAASLTPDGPVEEVDAIRWMIEELRVSFFAQTVGTAHPVSEERVLRAMDALCQPV